ncbi:MAG: hypothetical protein KDA57_02000 [Planctomycetales bacterium]|nr:hypothetical protein [Planctomycetales bacterium]
MRFFPGSVVVSLGLLILVIVCSEPAAGGISIIATTGTNASGVTDAEFNTLSAGAIANDGSIVFAANLTHGPGGVTSSDDEGVWLFDGSNTGLIAQAGSAGVPDLAGANFDSFAKVAISDSGEVLLRAALESGVGGVTSSSNQGFWRYPAGSGALVERTGVVSVPGVPNAKFESFPAALQTSSNGRIVHNGTMAKVAGGVTIDNDKGVWSYSGGVGTMVVREGVPGSVPGVGTSTFDAFGQPSINSNDQSLFSGSLKLGGIITTSNRLGIWQYTGTSGTLVTRAGVGGVPEVGGANFVTFDHYRQNNLGQVAIRATIDLGNDPGVWLFTGGSGEMLGRKGIGSVPGIASANFEDFDAALVNDGGQVLVRGELQVGPGGVTANDNLGLWFLDGSGSLVLRSGSGGVPELPATNFSDFSNYALNENGQLVVAATLEIGIGGVDSSNDSGLWLIDPDGVSRLVAREGDTLDGHTIASIDFLGGSGTNDGQSGGLNDLGHVAFQATFTDGDSGLFLFNPLDADFDFNAQVDSFDLLAWEAGYGTSDGASQHLGDADGDQDVDGFDLLAYQREFGSGVTALLAAETVPEPATWLLALAAAAWNWVVRRLRLSPSTTSLRL